MSRSAEMCSFISVTIIIFMDTGKLLEQQSAKIGKYVVTAIALDDRCNSFKVTVKSGENWFEETVGLFLLM
mgnify:CR=1 FL=1